MAGLEFPFLLHVGPFLVHPHLVFEALAYAIGFRAYLGLRRADGDVLGVEPRGWIVAAAIVGAAIGSKVLTWFSDPASIWAHRSDPNAWLEGKTIVGGLLGGLIAVEWTKRRLRVTRSTGDLFAIPLALGIAIGRIGCFLTGLPDRTHGTATSLPWGVNFGDGVLRHPTQLYEIAFLFLLIVHLQHVRLRGHREGDLFKTFLLAYCVWRFVVAFIQPGVPLAGLTAIQWACLLTILAYARHIPRLLPQREVHPIA